METTEPLTPKPFKQMKLVNNGGPEDPSFVEMKERHPVESLMADLYAKARAMGVLEGRISDRALPEILDELFASIGWAVEVGVSTPSLLVFNDDSVLVRPFVLGFSAVYSHEIQVFPSQKIIKNPDFKSEQNAVVPVTSANFIEQFKKVFPEEVVDTRDYDLKFVGSTSDLAFFLKRIWMTERARKKFLSKFNNESLRAEVEYLDGRIMLHCYDTMEASEPSETIQIFPYAS